MQNLLGALGQQAFQQYAVPWMSQPENMQYLINQGQQGLGALQQGLGNMYGYMGSLPGTGREKLGNLLSTLGSYIPGRQRQGV
jgi:hypothetical protein